jgi:hypothetical protein
VNADNGIQVLSETPDTFFGRTTATLEGKAQTVGNITTAVITPHDDDDSECAPLCPVAYSRDQVANRDFWGFGWEIAHAAVSRHPPIPSP